jgi:hypothetical protein
VTTVCARRGADRAFVILALACSMAQAERVHAQVAAATPVPATRFTVSRAASAIKIDGVLDEEAWRRATVVPILYEWLPGDNTPAPVSTDCLLTYDDDNLYVAFRAFDPNPSSIRAHLMDRDAINTFVQDDHVGFLIDTFNDERRGFQFRVNPLGVQADAVFSELDGIEDWSWDIIWASAGRITDQGYAVEVAIPLKQIRFPATSDMQTWGFEAFRSWPRSVRHRLSSRWTDRSKGCVLCQENKVTGFKGMQPGRNLELDSTATGHRTDQRTELPGGPMVAGGAKGDVGLTARWGVTTNLTLSAAANPDFSQVEADVAQLDVNTRFALFYPEKRPFFLEGVDFFSTPLQAVFTRTVADASGGLKLTGKAGANATGVFVTRDRINNLILPSNQGSSFASVDEDVTGAVLRYRRDVGAGSTLGVLYAGREASDSHNRVFGPDLFLRFRPSDTLRVQYLRSATEYPATVVSTYGQPAGEFGGNMLIADYFHTGRYWAWQATYTDGDRGFRADSGFIPRVDIRQGDFFVARRFWGGQNTWYSTFDLQATASRVVDHDGRLTDQSVSIGAAYTGPLQSQVTAFVEHDQTYVTGVTHDLTVARFTVSLKPSGALNLQLTGRAGGAVDFTNNRPATTVRLAPSVEWKIGAPVNVQFSHDFERLTETGGWLYDANLSQLAVRYQFNVRTFVRAILQYTDVSRRPDLFVQPVPASDRHLFSQYLFSYKLNPQTVLFLGYSDNYLGSTGLSLTQTNRTFFLKVGYAWLL